MVTQVALALDISLVEIDVDFKIIFANKLKEYALSLIF